MDSVHVFGASGAVGSFLLARLGAAGMRVVAYARQPRCDDHAAVRWQPRDLWRDSAGCDAATLISAGPLDALAGWLARVQTPALARVVALGSMSIETKRAAADATEREVAARLSDAERLLRETCAARGAACTLLRPTLIWGAGRDRSLTPLFRFGRRAGFVPVPVAHGGLRQPVHADDVAWACMLALASDASGGHTIELGGGERLAAAEMWRRVAAAADARALRLPIPLLRAGSVLLGARGVALRSALQRWHNDQIARAVADGVLPGWRPRVFAPAPTDFVPRP
jgi:nucleoside-diphosphate-sugar epimerase